jgi:hypothetical protein
LCFWCHASLHLISRNATDLLCPVFVFQACFLHLLP